MEQTIICKLLKTMKMRSWECRFIINTAVCMCVDSTLKGSSFSFICCQTSRNKVYVHIILTSKITNFSYYLWSMWNVIWLYSIWHLSCFVHIMFFTFFYKWPKWIIGWDHCRESREALTEKKKKAEDKIKRKHQTYLHIDSKRKMNNIKICS